MKPALTTTDSEVVAAVTGQQLARWAAAGTSEMASTTDATCAAIGEQVAADLADVVDWLAQRGVTVEADTVPTARQRHDVRVDVGSFDAADEVATLLAEHGFERWDNWTGAAARSFRAHAEQITVARTDSHSFVLRLRWRTPPGGGRARRLLRSVFRPTPGDWTLVSLPESLWPAYSAVRPIRLLLERVGRRDPHATGLGPFLSTPHSLISPLFDLVDLGPDDTLIDIGCGDGRLAIAAAHTVGCRSIGAESDSALVDRARQAAAAAGVEGLVTITHGDARDVDLSDVTVAFMFLPLNVVVEILDDTLRRLPRGARLIVHEQSPLPGGFSPRPVSSHAVIAEDAVTVAHLWVR